MLPPKAIAVSSPSPYRIWHRPQLPCLRFGPEIRRANNRREDANRGAKRRPTTRFCASFAGLAGSTCAGCFGGLAKGRRRPALLVAGQTSNFENFEFWRGSEPFVTQLRKTPSDSREPHLFVDGALVLDGESVELLGKSSSGLFALVRCRAGFSGWAQLKYLRALAPQAPAHEVQRHELATLSPEEFAGLDGRGPLILTGAAFRLRSVPGRPQQLLGLVEHIDLCCKTSPPDSGSSRVKPCFERFVLPKPATPVVVGKYSLENGTVTYRLSSDILLRSLDVIGYISLPFQSSDILEFVAPSNWLLRVRFSLSVLGRGADFLLRRDAVTHSQCCLVLAGRLRLRLLPPTVAAAGLEAVVGDLGCAVSQLDLFQEGTSTAELFQDILQVEVGEGDAILIPPGWWHQLSCLEGPAVMATAPYLTEAAAPFALQALASWRSQSSGLAEVEAEPLTHPVDAVEQLAAACRQLAAARGQERKNTNSSYSLGLGTWPFLGASSSSSSSSSEAPESGQQADQEEEFQFGLCRALQAFPAFVYSGAVLPADAPLWSAAELERFISSGGFLAPERRQETRSSEDELAPSQRLREWLQVPLPSNCPLLSADLHAQDAPRVIWMYWAQGASRLTGFRRLCVHSWRVQNPGWQVVVLDKHSVRQYVGHEEGELPERYEDLESAQQSDALRLALLARYGGVYTDVATLCLRPLEDWIWPAVSQGSLDQGLGAFYLACFGLPAPGLGREYVENWFLAARRAHPLVLAWRDLYVAGWRDAATRFEYPLGPLFRDVDLSHITIAEHRDWLLMHVCFKKLIDEDPEMHRIWSQEMTLLRADDSALAWMAEVDANKPEEAVLRWVFAKDPEWCQRQLDTAPMLKFVGDAAQALQWQPEEHLVGAAWDSCLSR
ncbi:unnamed protein product, partial [Polarella glacialis]